MKKLLLVMLLITSAVAASGCILYDDGDGYVHLQGHHHHGHSWRSCP